MTDRRSKLVSAFDDMLEVSRSRFNALDRSFAQSPGEASRSGNASTSLGP